MIAQIFVQEQQVLYPITQEQCSIEIVQANPLGKLVAKNFARLFRGDFKNGILYVHLVVFLLYNFSTQIKAQEDCSIQLIDQVISETTSNASTIGESIGVGDWIVYSRYEATTGTELWRTTGVPGNEQLVKDIFPGANSSAPEHFYALDSNKVIFFAFHPDFGIELWRTDGTEAGTQMIKDINPGPLNSLNDDDYWDQMITVIDDYLFFVACTEVEGCEIWRTNGTEAGTNLVEEIDDYYPNFAQIHELDQGIVIYLDRDLWITDGTPFGTYLIEENLNGERHVSDGKFYYQMDNGFDAELHVTDGSPAGTKFVNHVGYNFDLFSFDNQLYVHKDYRDTLFRLDPITDSLAPVLLLDFGTLLNQTEDYFYFSSTDSLGTELWISDGSPGNTRLVKDITPGEEDSRFYRDIIFNDIFLFTVDDGIHGVELWRSDGTEGGTQLVKDIVPGPDFHYIQAFYPTSFRLFFSNELGLFTTNGTEAGTIQITEVEGKTITDPDQIIVIDSILYFTAFVEDFGHQLIRSDGTDSGTRIVTRAEMLLNGLSWTMYRFTPIFNGYRYYFRDELYKVNQDTIINLGLEIAPSVLQWSVVEDRLYFAFYDYQFEQSIEQDLHFINEQDEVIPVDFITANVSRLFNYGHSKLLVEAYDSLLHYYFVITDGTPSGTYSIDNNGEGWDDFRDVFVRDTTIYFEAEDSLHGKEIWISDGTVTGTALLKDINPGTASSNPGNIQSLGDQVIFSVDDGTHGGELWITNGTDTGTHLLKNINTSGSAGINNLTKSILSPIDSIPIIYFEANDGVNGEEIWRTDGSETGTYPLDEDYFFGLANTAISTYFYRPEKNAIYVDIYNYNTQEDKLYKINLVDESISDLGIPNVFRIWSSKGQIFCMLLEEEGYPVGRLDMEADSLILFDTLYSRESYPSTMSNEQYLEDSLMFILNDDIALGYQLYTIACNLTEDCQPLVEVNGQITEDFEARSSDILKADASVQAPAILTLKSDNLIELLPNFEIMDGASLQALITTCDNN